MKPKTCNVCATVYQPDPNIRATDFVCPSCLGIMGREAHLRELSNNPGAILERIEAKFARIIELLEGKP